MLKTADLTGMTMKELDEELAKATKDLYTLQFEVRMGSSKEHHKVKQLKKYRARIITIKNELSTSEQNKFESQKVVESKTA